MVTLMFYPALLVSAWVSEYLSPEERAEAEELEHNRRLVCKQNIVDAAATQGTFADVDLVTGASDSFEAETLRADFKICLGVEDLKDATVDELLNVIDPESRRGLLLFISYKQGTCIFHLYNQILI